ncbi:hypothetical protein [Streptomyces sp. F001]|uniref:hypothetical protein n=1 Tax=Streptomyces sp. F001 TaxID=1510026 RepID=UPI001F0D6D5E|nr:hypothetical protein [Streptomyces sp. F001]
MGTDVAKETFDGREDGLLAEARIVRFPARTTPGFPLTGARRYRTPPTAAAAAT